MPAAKLKPRPQTHPKANILVDGFRTPLDRFPENQEVMGAHTEQTLRAFSPRTGFHVWISDEIAMSMIRIDRIGRMDRRLRDQSALRAEHFWEDDRRLLAIELGEKLSARPEKTVAKLKATPQGCDWLIRQWGWLKAALDGGKTWGEEQNNTAFDLLGIAPNVREFASALLADPAGLVRDEVAALDVRKTKVAESDALERTLAMTDSVDPNTKEYRSLKRLEGRTHRRMKWMIELLDLIPKFVDAHPAILEARNLLPMDPIARREALQPVAPPPAEPEPEPEAAPPPLPKPWAPSAPAIRPTDLPPLPNPTSARRPDPVKLRARTRSEAARRRREDRPDR